MRQREGDALEFSLLRTIACPGRTELRGCAAERQDRLTHRGSLLDADRSAGRKFVLLPGVEAGTILFDVDGLVVRSRVVHKRTVRDAEERLDALAISVRNVMVDHARVGKLDVYAGAADSIAVERGRVVIHRYVLAVIEVDAVPVSRNQVVVDLRSRRQIGAVAKHAGVDADVASRDGTVIHVTARKNRDADIVVPNGQAGYRVAGAEQANRCLRGNH